MATRKRPSKLFGNLLRTLCIVGSASKQPSKFCDDWKKSFCKISAVSNSLFPEGALRKQNPLSILLCLEMGIWHFQFINGNSPFWDFENVLSPEGTLQSRAQRGTFNILLFYYFSLSCPKIFLKNMCLRRWWSKITLLLCPKNTDIYDAQ